MTSGKKICASIIIALLFGIAIVFPFTAFHFATDDAFALLEEAKRLSMLKNWHSAAPLFEKAEALLHASGNESDQAYARIGRIRARAEETSEPHASRLLSEELATGLLRTNKQLRLWCLMSKGDIDLTFDSRLAKQDWLEALQIATELGDRRWIARATGHVGIMEFIEGNAGQGERDITKAIKSAYFNGDVGALIQFLSIAGVGLNDVQRYDEALPLLSRAVELAETTDAGFPYFAYEGLAAVHLARGDRKEAIKLALKALDNARRENQHGAEGYILIVLGDIALAAGQKEAAKGYFEKATSAFRSIGFDRGIDEAKVKLAGILRAEGRLEEAANALEIALKIGPGMDVFYRPRTLTELAELRMEQGRPSDANGLFEAAEDLRESIAIKLHSPLEIGAMTGSLSDTYLAHFLMAVGQHDTHHAFTILERVRGRWAAGLLYAQDPQVPKQTALDSEIDGVQRVLMGTEDAQQRRYLLQKLFQLEQEFAIAANDSTSDKRQSPQEKVTVASVQQVLREDELILEYVIAADRSFCIAISKEDAELIVLPAGGGRLKSLVDSFLAEVKAKGSTDVPGTELYKILLAPVVRKFSQQHLIISPDGPLALLPFEALRDQNSDFVVRSRIVSYTTSSSQLLFVRTRAAGNLPRRPLLAIGDVDYRSGYDWRVHLKPSVTASVFRSLADLNSNKLGPLSSSRDEVLSIARNSDSSAVILTGKEATETKFKSLPLSEFRVIHIATHAVPDPQYPLRAAVVLGADPKNDGLLQVREILRLSLQADLVVLSACETKVGIHQGEAGITSLEQAFMTAGARSTLGSLWAVEDYSTSRLMKAFYDHLARGEDKATALTRAKLDLLQQDPQLTPFYWAGFTLQGEGATAVSLKAKD